MYKLIILLGLVVIFLMACGGQEEEAADVVDSGAQSLSTATPLPTPEPLKTELDEAQPAAGGETSPVPTPDQAAKSISPVPPPTAGTDNVRPPMGSEALVAKAKEMLAGMPQVRTPVEQIALVSIESREWRDGSLGCPQPGQMYIQVITPGYMMILEAGGQQYEFHSDQTDTVVACFEESRKIKIDDGFQVRRPLPQDAVMFYGRQGGFAGVIEGWTIYTDGRVVDVDGAQAQLSPEVITELLTMIEEAGFFTMAPEYLPDNTCCDLFTYEIVVRKDNQTHSIVVIDSAPNLPPELERILGEVDAVVRASDS